MVFLKQTQHSLNFLQSTTDRLLQWMTVISVVK